MLKLGRDKGDREIERKLRELQRDEKLKWIFLSMGDLDDFLNWAIPSGVEVGAFLEKMPIMGLVSTPCLV